MSELLDYCQRIVDQTLGKGADEADVVVSKGRHVTIIRRDGKVEQATEASTQGLVLSLLSNGCYTSNSTSDLRKEAVDRFIDIAIKSASYLEPDPYRALPESEQCGRGATDKSLELADPQWWARTEEQRDRDSKGLEEAMAAHGTDDLISSSTYTADGSSEVARVMSNGFAQSHQSAWFAAGGEMTLLDGEQRPESAAYFASCFLKDLPDNPKIAQEVVRRTRERMGAKPIPTGTYPMLLDRITAGRLLSALGDPLSGGSIHEGRSCLSSSQGELIASPCLTILDAPLIPRGLGSRPWDSDGLKAKPFPVIENGVLTNYYIDTYYGRKLQRDATTGHRSNWVISPGKRTEEEIAKEIPKAIRITSFLGGNSNGTTGDFSFGIRGVLLEHGEPVHSLSEMNVSGNITTIFSQLAEVARDPWLFSSVRTPTLLFENVQFSGT